MGKPLKKDTIKKVYEVLFGSQPLQEDEWIEIDYDRGGDNQFVAAFYVKDVEELMELLEVGNGLANYAIHYTTKRFKRCPMKRSSKKDAYRCRAIIIDFEPTPKKKRLTRVEWDTLYREVMKFLGKYPDIANAIALVGYTGGGGQLYIQLSRFIQGNELDTVLSYLKNLFSECEYVDTSCFRVSQGQRLLGTWSVKWDVQTDIIYDLRSSCKPLDVDNILRLAEIEEELEIRREGEVEKANRVIENLKDVIEEIKRRVKFSDLGYTGKDYGTYTMINCPFHPPDNKPSFAIYHKTKDGRDIDLAIDFHTGEVYDIISFYQAIHEKSFIDAIKELAKMANISIKIDKKEEKKYKIEEEIKEFDFEEYLREELRVRKIVSFKNEKGLHFEITVEDKYGEIKTFEVSIREIRRFSRAEVIFLSYTYHIPEKVEQELWDKILEYMIDKAIKPEEYEEYDRSIMKYEIDFLEFVIFNSEGTNDIKEFFENKATKYFDPSGEVYLNLARLLFKVSGSPAFQIKSPNHIAKLLRHIGARPVVLRNKDWKKRCWLLPNDRDWRSFIKDEEIEEIMEGGAIDVQQEIYEQEQVKKEDDEVDLDEVNF